MDWLDYREKLTIGFNDTEKTKYFYTKIFNLLDDIKYQMQYKVSGLEYYNFCDMTGTVMSHGDLYGEEYSCIIKTLKNHTKKLTDFIAYYIAFINCLEENEISEGWTKKHFKNLICKHLDESHIPFELIEDNGSCFIFPKGVKEFDDALVSDVLLWLKDYPLTEKSWVKALKDYSEATEETASEIADKFRKALECFFQEFFKKEKSLENLKSEYGTYLSSKGVPAEIRNNFEKLLEAYTNYNNNYAKHHDKASKDVLEYIMYQTGSLIRLIIKLK